MASGDAFGLRQAFGGLVLPVIVAAMAFLAALAAAGAVGAQDLAADWLGGAASAATVEIPRPEEDGRLDRALGLLRGDPAVTSAEPVSPQALGQLLRPWLGGPDAPTSPVLPGPVLPGPVLPGLVLPGLMLPGVIAIRVAPGAADTAPLAARLAAAVPEATIEDHAPWMRRLASLAASVRACAWIALGVVAAVAAMVVSVTTRAGLAARHDAIELVHGLGGTDGDIALRFSRRATWLAASGGMFGALLALPVLVTLAALAAPLAGRTSPALSGAGAEPGAPVFTALGAPLAAARALPTDLWIALAALPCLAAVIGFATAQATVRRWLHRLP